MPDCVVDACRCVGYTALVFRGTFRFALFAITGCLFLLRAVPVPLLMGDGLLLL